MYCSQLASIELLFVAGGVDDEGLMRSIQSKLRAFHPADRWHDVLSASGWIHTRCSYNHFVKSEKISDFQRETGTADRFFRALVVAFSRFRRVASIFIDEPPARDERAERFKEFL